ncbi:MAG TPA: hypothetical protein VGR95_01660 [Thermoanaerobaculia bacterium]|jgi:plastocyanin|nr:hypothetical protein [Thermoanaerobaculia bacterium]
MSDQNWSIMITSSGFVVDAFGQSGSALSAGSGDTVAWNNQTNDTHQPYTTDQNYNPIGPALCDPIPGFKSSTPGYVLNADNPPETIYYYCQNHPTNTAERGTIVITD